MSETLSLFGDALSDLASSNTVHSVQGGLTKALMTRLNEKGLTLEQCSDRRVMSRSTGTLKRHARAFGVVFSDYVPRALRPKHTKCPWPITGDVVSLVHAQFDGRLALFHMGDFYEALGSDAETMAKTLGLVLAKRAGMEMCGVPVHALADTQLALAKAGHAVVLCEPKMPRKRKVAP